jgi:geranylgeranyl pyrophosphate synthase
MFSNKNKLNKTHHETAALIETIHNASIMHDDVIDNNFIRRNTNSFLKTHGYKESILIGDFIIIESIKRFLNLHTKDKFAKKYFLKECRNTAYGALLEQKLNKSNTVFEIGECIKMMAFKTSPLFKLSCLLGAHLTEQPFSLCKKAAMFGVYFGIIFQAQNDINSYQFVEYHESEDYMQKNITLPIIILCNNFGFSLENFKKNTNQKDYLTIKKNIFTVSFEKRLNHHLQNYIDYSYILVPQPC